MEQWGATRTEVKETEMKSPAGNSGATMRNPELMPHAFYPPRTPFHQSLGDFAHLTLSSINSIFKNCIESIKFLKSQSKDF